MPEAAFFSSRSLKFFSLLPMLTKAASLRQITDSRAFGNEVSEKETVVSVQLSVAIRGHSFWHSGHWRSELQKSSDH
jgi:hypothetical protein